jgi:hypothetical protein
MSLVSTSDILPPMETPEVFMSISSKSLILDLKASSVFYIPELIEIILN